MVYWCTFTPLIVFINKIKNMEQITDIGVIIGRFQIHELHEAHKDLFDKVIDRHQKVIVFLGVSPVLGSKRNPLDFPTRQQLILSEYGSKIAAVLPIHDNRSDLAWSKEIDKRIREVFQIGDVTLYGSRDSFIPHYEGQFKTHELETKIYLSGTDVRKNVSKKILASPEFRAGIIYGIYNTYPIVYSTIDIAIFNNEGEILLARKPNDPTALYRFIGGFVDPKDDSDFAACRREGFEETGAEIEPYEYVCSAKVDDWRYRNEEDRKIMTRLYKAKYVSGRIEPNDDISELKLFKISEIDVALFVPEHRPLATELLKNLKK